MKKFLSVLGLILLSICIGLLLWMKNSSSEEEIMNLNSSQKNLEETIEKIRTMEEQVNEAASAHHLEMGDSHIHLDGIDNLDYYSTKKGTIEFLFASVKMNDANLFLQSFDTMTMSEDLFKDERKDKMAVAQSMMDRISRNQTLDQILYAEKKGVFGTIADEVETTLIYQDEVKVTLSIKLTTLKNQHHGNDLYYIATSAWDIIDSIEKSTKSN